MRGRPRGHLMQRLHAPIGDSRQPFDLLLIGEDDIFTGGRSPSTPRRTNGLANETVVRVVLMAATLRALPRGYLVDLIGSSRDILRMFPHLEHSKILRLGPSRDAPTWISIIRLWQAGHSGRGIGINVGSGRL